MLKKNIKLAYDRTMKDITPNRGLRRNVVLLHSLRPQHQICSTFVLSVQTGRVNSSSGEAAVRIKPNLELSVVPRQVARVAWSVTLRAQFISDHMALPLLHYMHCMNSMKNDQYLNF